MCWNTRIGLDQEMESGGWNQENIQKSKNMSTYRAVCLTPAEEIFDFHRNIRLDYFWSYASLCDIFTALSGPLVCCHSREKIRYRVAIGFEDRYYLMGRQTPSPRGAHAERRSRVGDLARIILRKNHSTCLVHVSCIYRGALMILLYPPQ